MNCRRKPHVLRNRDPRALRLSALLRLVRAKGTGGKRASDSDHRVINSGLAVTDEAAGHSAARYRRKPAHAENEKEWQSKALGGRFPRRGLLIPRVQVGRRSRY